MRTATLFFFSLITTLNVSSQKHLKTDVDKSTGDTTFSTSESRIYVKSGAPKSIAESLKCTVFKTKNGYMLRLFIETGRTSVLSISKGSIVDIKLMDGNTVSLVSRIDNDSRTSSIAYGCFVSGFYTLHTRDIADLKASMVESIKIESSAGSLNYELKEKFSGTIGEQLRKFSEN